MPVTLTPNTPGGPGVSSAAADVLFDPTYIDPNSISVSPGNLITAGGWQTNFAVDTSGNYSQDGTPPSVDTAAITMSAVMPGTNAFATRSTGTTSIWTLTTGVKAFNVTSGDFITATYSPGSGFNGSSGSTTAAVTVAQLPITVTATANTKRYDDSTSAAATPTITPSLVAGDTADYFETYDTKNLGTGKTLTAAGSVNDGDDGGNYSVTIVANTCGAIEDGSLTTTTVTASQLSVVYGTAVTFTASVSAQSGTLAPSRGSVDFYDTTTVTDLGAGAFGEHGHDVHLGPDHRREDLQSHHRGHHHGHLFARHGLHGQQRHGDPGGHGPVDHCHGGPLQQDLRRHELRRGHADDHRRQPGRRRLGVFQ